MELFEKLKFTRKNENTHLRAVNIFKNGYKVSVIKIDNLYEIMIFKSGEKYKLKNQEDFVISELTESQVENYLEKIKNY